MAKQLTDEERLKEVVKSPLVEVLEERKDLAREVIEEALEDAALARAIEEGDRTGIVNREEILRTLGVCRKNSFSLRNLSALCVSAVNLPAKTAHRRDAENAENAQSSFSDRLLDGNH